MDSYTTVLLLLFLVTCVLLVLVQALFVEIRRSDGNLYERLGRPDIFTNNHWVQIARFWRWIYGEPVTENLSIAARRLAFAIRLTSPLLALALVGLIIISSVRG